MGVGKNLVSLLAAALAGAALTFNTVHAEETPDTNPPAQTNPDEKKYDDATRYIYEKHLENTWFDLAGLKDKDKTEDNLDKLVREGKIPNLDALRASTPYNDWLASQYHNPIPDDTQPAIDQTKNATPKPVQTDDRNETIHVEQYLKHKGRYDDFVAKMHKDDPAKKDNEFEDYLETSGLAKKIEETASFKAWINEGAPTDIPAPEPSKPVQMAIPPTIPNSNPVTPIPAPKVEPVIPQTPAKPDTFELSSDPLNFPSTAPSANPIPADIPAPITQTQAPASKSKLFASLYARGNSGANKSSSDSSIYAQGIAGLESDSGRQQIVAQGLFSDKKYLQVNDVAVKTNSNNEGLGFENNRFSAKAMIGKSTEVSTDPLRFTSSSSPPLKTDTYTNNKTTVSTDDEGFKFNINLNRDQNAKKASWPRIAFAFYNRSVSSTTDTDVRTDVINSIDPTADYTIFISNKVKIKDALQGFDFEALNSFRAEQWDDGEYLNYGIIGRISNEKITGPSLDRKVSEIALGVVFGGEFNRHSVKVDEDGRKVFKDHELVMQSDGLMWIYDMSIGALQTKDNAGINNDKLSMFGFADIGFYHPDLSVVGFGNSKDNKSGEGGGAILFKIGTSSGDGINVPALFAMHNYFKFANRTETGFNSAYGKMADLANKVLEDYAVSQLASFSDIDGVIMGDWANNDAESRIGAKGYVLFPIDKKTMLKANAHYSEGHTKGGMNYITINAGAGIGALTSGGSSLDLLFDTMRDARRKDAVNTIGLTYTYYFREP